MLISNRANTILLVAILAVGIGIVAMLATGARGGPLDPPGSPASTDGVRQAGTPIAAVPFAITTPGRYYFTRNLSYSGGTNAITIAADDVDIDLGGFTLVGPGTDNTQAIYDLGQAHQNVSVEHGAIRAFQYGIWLSSITGGHISDVRIVGYDTITGTVGIEAPKEALIEDCDIAKFSNGVDMQTQSVMRRCHIHDNGQFGVTAGSYGILVEDSDIELTAAGGAGVLAYANFITLRNNRFAKNGSGYNSDVDVSAGVASVTDNVLDCTTSAQASGTGQIVTTGPGGSHPNIPLFGPGFCSQP